MEKKPKELTFKKVGAYAIIGVIFTGLVQVIDPLFKIGAMFFTIGGNYENINAQIANHKKRLDENDHKITLVDRSTKEFRATWCIDRLSSKGKVSDIVLKTCTEWIKNP